jgi:hypothetical protein
MKKIHLLFLLTSIFVLIVSEYFFVRELFGTHQLLILILSGTGIASGVIFLVSLIKKYT